MTQREPVRVFVAVDAGQIVPARVLEYSIRKHTPRTVECILVEPTRDGEPRGRKRGNPTADGVAVPRVTGSDGRALHLSGDSHVFADLSEVYDLPFDGHTILSAHEAGTLEASNDDHAVGFRDRPAVMLVDYARLPRAAEAPEEDGHPPHAAEGGDVHVVPAGRVSERLSGEWNSIERYDPDETKLLRYASVSMQPWRNDGSPLRELWMESFREALAANAIDPELVLEGIAAGHLDPKLRPELHHHPGWSRETDRLHGRLERKGARLEKTEAKLGTTNAKLAKASADAKKTKRRYRRTKERLRRAESSLAWRGRTAAASAARRAFAFVGTDSAVSFATRRKALKVQAERGTADKGRRRSSSSGPVGPS